jgi:hypothetical protein
MMLVGRASADTAVEPVAVRQLLARNIRVHAFFAAMGAWKRSKVRRSIGRKAVRGVLINPRIAILMRRRPSANA